jgi:hypothetical protein
LAAGRKVNYTLLESLLWRNEEKARQMTLLARATKQQAKKSTKRKTVTAFMSQTDAHTVQSTCQPPKLQNNASVRVN